jgi:hypothetical protein
MQIPIYKNEYPKKYNFIAKLLMKANTHNIKFNAARNELAKILGYKDIYAVEMNLIDEKLCKPSEYDDGLSQLVKIERELEQNIGNSSAGMNFAMKLFSFEYVKNIQLNKLDYFKMVNLQTILDTGKSYHEFQKASVDELSVNAKDIFNEVIDKNTSIKFFLSAEPHNESDFRLK